MKNVNVEMLAGSIRVTLTL